MHVLTPYDGKGLSLDDGEAKPCGVGGGSGMFFGENNSKLGLFELGI